MVTSSGLVIRLDSPPPDISSAFACTIFCNSSFSCSSDVAISSCPGSIPNLHLVSSFSDIQLINNVQGIKLFTIILYCIEDYHSNSLALCCIFLSSYWQFNKKYNLS